MSKLSVKHIGADDRDLERGQQVGEYTVVEKIGEGGFGTVFRADHPLIGKQVAIKVLGRQFSADEEMVSRFVSEAAAVNRIRHRNIIDIFSFGQLEDGRHYYIMELLSGRPLDDYMQQNGPLPLDSAVTILRGVSRALDAAHAKGIVHRDLKPENIFLLEEEGAPPFPKLLDFGIAKLMGNEDQKGFKTRTGVPMGTPSFMAPEQCRGRDVDHRADIYSFGIVCYQMLCGKLPFGGEDYMEILMAQIGEEPAPPSSHCPTLPSSVDDAIAWMMRKNPDSRPPNLVTAVKALEDAASEAGFQLPPAATPSAVYSNTTVPGDTKNKSHASMVSAPTEIGILPTQISSDSAILEAAANPTVNPVVAGNTRSPYVYVGAALLMGVLAAAAFVLMGNDKSESSDKKRVAVKKSKKRTTPAVTLQSTPDAATAKVVVTNDAAPALSKYVQIEILNVPEQTKVFSPSGRVGIAPGMVQLERGDEPLNLTFEAEGFRSKTLSVSVNADGDFDVEGLDSKKRRTPKKKNPKGASKNSKNTIEKFE